MRTEKKQKTCDPKTAAFLEAQGIRDKEINFCSKASKELHKKEAKGHYVEVKSGSYKASILIMPGDNEKEKIQRHLSNRRLVK